MVRVRDPDIMRILLRLATLFVLLPALMACSAGAPDLAYYLQSASGHLRLMGQARAVDELLADGTTTEPLAGRLRLAQQIRSFASRELGLPDNGSYTRYAEIGRPFVVWNVFAAPELSLDLKRWCFPVAGCVSYRGYFDRDEAERAAEQLRADGWDVQIAGVPAYSTLGWFDDPLLSSFIGFPEPELARLIFHELAHQVVYLKGDSTFNESFATAVEEAGVQRWLAHRADPRLQQQASVLVTRRQEFIALLRRHRAQLQAVYASGVPDLAKREAKRDLFAALRAEYEHLKTHAWQGFSGFDRWFASMPGNAHLASVATYNALVPAFRAMLAEQNGDMRSFFDAVTKLAEMDVAERDRWTKRYSGRGAPSADSTSAFIPQLPGASAKPDEEMQARGGVHD